MDDMNLGCFSWVYIDVPGNQIQLLLTGSQDQKISRCRLDRMCKVIMLPVFLGYVENYTAEFLDFHALDRSMV